MNTIEGNKLIMDFLGWKHHSGDVYWFPNLYPSQEHYTGETTFNIDEARFHSSWDWLMPVVEKIEQLGYDTNIISYLGDNITIISEGTPQGDGGKYVENIADETAETKIQTTWQAVIQFIEWRNKEQSVKESDTSKAT